MQKVTALFIGSGNPRKCRLGSHLQSIGIELHKASSAPIAKQKLCEHKYDLLLIQFESIHRHTFDLCTFTRHENHDIVIIVLMSKVRPIIESRLFAFGIDDVAAGKQIFAPALTARIKRRLTACRLHLQEKNKIMLKGGALVDLDSGEVRLNRFCHRLKGVSYKLFRYFIENPNRIVSKEELIGSHIWDNSVCMPSKIEGGKAVDMAITRLRRLIESDPSAPQVITTVHGTGWIFTTDAVL